ncbi:hypothetical protein [Diaphorobacter caeni]|uniref:hypothetical protein n=1 Tax=Diaphorobacter caeni TaxID=2784387 RepID=UPI00188E9D08|nr:hypothetical protein [Diaphorobacter caeni]MBF5006365.1 hypothetical protein [Diaphorobacter caeni]
MSRLIAMVATAVLVNGERTVIQPGEPLPELPEHDEGELLANGMAMDPEKAAANDKAKKAEEAAALKAFQAAREKVKAEQESTQSSGDESGASGDSGAPDDQTTQKAKPAAKTATTKK